MKLHIFLVLILLIFSTSMKGQSQKKEVVLFNGQDLNGWEGEMKYWRVEEGMIVGEFTEIEHNQFLRSKTEVEDFRLILQVRLTDGQGNSGIQFRSTALPGGHVRGPQADIGKGYWGKLYEELGRGWLWEKGCDRYVDSGGWNEYEIVAVDSKVRTAINGNLCVDIDDPYIARKGIIALQLHAGFAPAEIYFKNFELTKDPEFELRTLD